MGSFFKKKAPLHTAVAATPQIRRSAEQPFGILQGYTPLQQGESRLYRAIREAVPVVEL